MKKKRKMKWMVKKYYKARNDDQFFEQISRIIFIAGFRYSVVNQKWPAIRKAFSNFSINKVAKYRKRDVARLMKNKNIIKNRPKIQAIIDNAEICKDIQEGHDSVLSG